LKVLLVNPLAALNFANVFLKIKKRLENKKTLKNVCTSMRQTDGRSQTKPDQHFAISLTELRTVELRKPQGKKLHWNLGR